MCHGEGNSNAVVATILKYVNVSISIHCSFKGYGMLSQLYLKKN